MLPSSEIKELTIKDYFEIARKHFWLILTISVVTTGFVAFYDFSSPKIYLATTTIVIETERPNITGKLEDVYERELIGKDYYQTQINVLMSRSLADRVAKSLGLDRDSESIGHKDFVGELLSMIKIESAKVGNTAVISVTGKDPLKITAIANAWVREFIHQDVERKVGTAKYGISFLENQLADTLGKLKTAEKELNDFIRVNKMVTVTDIETKTEALLESLKSQKAQLEKEIAEAAQRYKEKHPKMISLKTQAKAVADKLNEEINNRLSLQERMAEYGVLKRQVDTYKYLYDDFLKRAKELDVSKELTISNIRVIDPAEEPKVPIKPKPTQDIPVAMLVSFVLSIILALFLERLDSTMKTSDDVEFFAKFPFLGYIPAVKKELKDKKNIDIVSYIESNSRVAESFRNLKVSLLFSFPQEKPLRTIVITSSIPVEGKSFVSSNLAIIFAQAKEPTLLIDSDMRKGNLHKSFGLRPKNGLSGLLAGMISLEEAIIPAGIPNLWLLPAGPYTPNPTELLSSEKLPNILRELEKKFKRIIIDSTPILNVSEALILGDKCDGLIFVIRARYTALKYIDEAKRIIEKKVKVIGAVLNDTDMQRDRYYYYHYYYPSSRENGKG
ncbi:MAG: polysaccharide biosynthesis tyrosine autokinase [Candidatus Omnitrophota bacterium]|nr:polysaccharide biosynthesis tyrosine autokinase [Candidatus Omnitrophota bacterium]